MENSNRPRILLMGPRRSGKSSIQRVVFQKMSPHETLFLESTNGLEIKHIANNPFVQFEVWDFPGDIDLKEDIVYEDQILTPKMIFGTCVALVYVIDAQDDPSADALGRLKEMVEISRGINENIFFEVFIHKVDGDLFLSEDLKIDCQRDIQQQVALELEDAGFDMQFSYYLTSIYDQSIFEAFSKVVQKLVPQLPAMENLLNILIGECEMEKAFLFDVVSKIYVATDHKPLDIQSYELCSDMIDVVIDVSCIYGMKDDASDEIAYDDKSSSVIRLNNNMVLYLRQVASYLALVCLIRTQNFEKQGLIDYNIDCFKTALSKIFLIEDPNGQVLEEKQSSAKSPKANITGESVRKEKIPAE